MRHPDFPLLGDKNAVWLMGMETGTVSTRRNPYVLGKIKKACVDYSEGRDREQNVAFLESGRVPLKSLRL